MPSAAAAENPENPGRERVSRQSTAKSAAHSANPLRPAVTALAVSSGTLLTTIGSALAGEDVNLAVARDASVTKGVMLDHYVSEEDAEMKAKADRMYRRICEGLTAEVAEAFGHQASGTEDLERQLREAVAAKDWDRAKRLSGQLAKQGRQAG